MFRGQVEADGGLRYIYLFLLGSHGKSDPNVNDRSSRSRPQFCWKHVELARWGGRVQLWRLLEHNQFKKRRVVKGRASNNKNSLHDKITACIFKFITWRSSHSSSRSVSQQTLVFCTQNGRILQRNLGDFKIGFFSCDIIDRIMRVDVFIKCIFVIFPYKLFEFQKYLQTERIIL